MDDANQILIEIIFIDIYGWSKLRDITKTKFRNWQENVIRHIKSRQWIKNKIKVTYENRKTSDLIKESQVNNSRFTENISNKDYLSIANIIATNYLNTVIDETNLHCCDKYYDNFGGKMSMILKSYIEAGKNSFPKCGSLIIRLDEKKSYQAIKIFMKVKE